MAATSAERVLYAAKSRKWNSTQNNKFPAEFPLEQAANLEWIRKAEEAARKRAEEELRGIERAEQEKTLQRQGQQVKGKVKGENGVGKWVIVGVVGVIVALRAWQRYQEGASV